MALGASPASLRRLILGESAKLALFGLAAGIPAALASARFLSSMLFAVTPADPLTFIGVALVLTMVALASCIFSSTARNARRSYDGVALRVVPIYFAARPQIPRANSRQPGH